MESNMKAFVFCIVMNFVAAVVLIGAGGMEMNNLGTGSPAVLCAVAGVCGILQLSKKKT